MRVLVVNSGSSSLKLRVIDSRNELVASADLPAVGSGTDESTIEQALAGLGEVDAVGHRIVHGSTEFTGPVRIDPAVLERLRSFVDLAPLHQPASLIALDAVTKQMQHVPAVACFDTAFHAGMPPAAATYAIPEEWRSRFGIRRYGFHGLSHSYASKRAAELVGERRDSHKVITCHLGAGASLAAVNAGRSVDTTMGFTPLEGLVMATRSGSLDPGLVLWLEEHVGIPAGELADAFEHRSGLMGLAGTGDMRKILLRWHAGDFNAGVALGVYMHRLRAGIASMAAAMNGADLLVFTGGVGERSFEVRKLAADGLAFLGVTLDEEANRNGQGDRIISPGSSQISTLVVFSREDIEIAEETRRVLGAT